MSEQTFIITIDKPEQKVALKAIAKAFKMKYEEAKYQYTDDFVSKMRLSEEEIKQGKTTRVKQEDFKELLGL